MIRFWSKVDKSGGPDACWPWTASTFLNGYGQFRVGKNGDAQAHRWAFRLANKIEPGDFYVLHSCANRLCCNPAHLRAGTHAENMRDMVAHGNTQRGEKHKLSKLTESKVRRIRELFRMGETQHEIAAEFGVSRALVKKIATNVMWSHVR